MTINDSWDFHCRLNRYTCHHHSIIAAPLHTKGLTFAVQYRSIYRVFVRVRNIVELTLTPFSGVQFGCFRNSRTHIDTFLGCSSVSVITELTRRVCIDQMNGSKPARPLLCKKSGACNLRIRNLGATSAYVRNGAYTLPPDSHCKTTLRTCTYISSHQSGD
jgi:hypothetical protein